MAGGIRQAGGGPAGGWKRPARGPTGQGSADTGGPVCGQTPTAEIDVSALVRTRSVMSRWQVF